MSVENEARAYRFAFCILPGVSSQRLASILWLAMLVLTISLSGCAAGGQAVEWNHAEALDYRAGGAVELEVAEGVNMPFEEEAFLERDVRQNVRSVLRGSDETYRVRVIIVKYDEGSSFARFMLAGLGSMHLDGVVEVTAGDPPRVVRKGKFEKTYAMGGIIGASATMHDDVVVKVGEAIAEALKEPPSDAGDRKTTAASGEKRCAGICP